MTSPSQPDREPVVFLKLGGSLITDKTRPETARLDVLDQLAGELQSARTQAPHLRILLGHGSGSFGHVAADRHGTRRGVNGAAGWLGFAEVADAAARLNRIVAGQLLAAGVPVWSIQPSASAHCEDGRLVDWQSDIVELALERGLLPLVYGDTVLDGVRGGTIASTEELFGWLLPRLLPVRIVLAGIVDGVFDSDPLRNPDAALLPVITPATLPGYVDRLGRSHGVDVTGGMLSKVNEMCRLVAAYPQTEVRLVSGLRAGAVLAAVLGHDAGGTRILADAAAAAG
ncbi:MAG: isopentenyl phosphate kinase family protein [Anaerolineae bacterium]|nr:isopentenyl phosphate kinase family protein [Anaerolineae bacterium]